MKERTFGTATNNNTTLRGDGLRAVIILIAASALGLLVNQFSSSRIAIFDEFGPGALPQPVDRITCEALKPLLADKKAILIDARFDDRYEAGHPANALHLTYDDCKANYPKMGLSLDDNIVVMCDSEECPLADDVAHFLLDQRHKNVHVLYGGWEAYKTCGLPIASGGSPK